MFSLMRCVEACSELPGESSNYAIRESLSCVYCSLPGCPPAPSRAALTSQGSGRLGRWWSQELRLILPDRADSKETLVLCQKDSFCSKQLHLKTENRNLTEWIVYGMWKLAVKQNILRRLCQEINKALHSEHRCRSCLVDGFGNFEASLCF